MPIGRPAGTRDSRGGGDRVCRSGADYLPGESAVLSAAEDHACLGGSCRRRSCAGSGGLASGAGGAALRESILGICSGDRVILQNGVVIGGDGLGFAKQKDGRWYKMAQSGPAVLEDDVEVQANACVDRATVGETRIGRGSKLDDLVLIGHASQVGANTMLCGQVGLAGSTRIGAGCILAGQVGTAGHLSVGDGAVVTAKSGIPSDIPPKSLFSGYPAVENRQWLKTMAALNRLPELQKRVRELEEEIKRLGGA